MTKSWKAPAAGLALLLALPACTGAHSASMGLGGAVSGGILGSLLGGRSGALAGAILGGMIGASAGAKLDARDKRMMRYAMHRSLERLPSGRAQRWRNPDSGNYGTITPVRTYQRRGGRYCREFQQLIIVAGKRHQAYGTACRQPDGNWQIVK